MRFDVGGGVARLGLAEHDEVRVARVQRGHVGGRPGGRAPFEVHARAFAGGREARLRGVAPRRVLRLVCGEPQAFVAAKERPHQILAHDVQADHVCVPAPREVERELGARAALAAIVDMDEQSLEFHHAVSVG